MPFTDQVLDWLLHERVLKSKNGRRLLRERPIISTNSINLDKLKNLPKSTFGRRYWEFLDMEQVSPDTRAPIHYLDDASKTSISASSHAHDEMPVMISQKQAHDLSERAYLMLRYRQIHDFLHTLTNVPTTLAGELALKWFEFMHFRLPMSLMAGLVGPVRLLNSSMKFQDFHHAGRFARASLTASSANDQPRSDMEIFVQDYWPWAVQAGSSSECLLCQPWEELFEEDLQQLRIKLNIIPYQSSAKSE